MKIALIGYGKMGRMVEQAAVERGHVVSARLTAASSSKEREEALHQADMGIDFSHSAAVLVTLEQAIHLGRDLVIGTTGWEEKLEQAKAMVARSQIGCLYAPNFSMGVYLFLQLAALASSLATSWGEYDMGIAEMHHKQKQDAPSGTGKALANVIYRCNPHVTAKELPISSLRCGSFPGTHSLILDSSCDTITLTHQARNRTGFACGAVRAAEWLTGKRGFFTIDDFMRHSRGEFPERVYR